jgi:hypothetical protein
MHACSIYQYVPAASSAVDAFHAAVCHFPLSACILSAAVFVRPSTKQRPGDRDAKPYQILTTDKRSIVVYNLKSSTTYRVDIVAVNK